MATRSTARMVLTYTLLMKRALELRRRDETAFSNLVGEGTTALVKGLKAKWVLRNKSGYFLLEYETSAKKTKTLAKIVGLKRKGEWYTCFDMRLNAMTPSKLIEKHLPVHFPGGRISGYRTSKCTKFFQTDALGNVQDKMSVYWNVHPKGGLGHPDSAIAIEDNTGRPLPWAEIVQKNLTGHWNNGYYDAGFSPHASDTRTEWLKSVASMPGIDQRLTVECALRCAKVAMELTAEFPAIRALYFPAFEFGDLFTDKGSYRPTGDIRLHAPLGFTGAVPCETWILPELILYWADGVKTSGAVGETSWQTLSILIPPHGNSELSSTGNGKPPVMRAPQQLSDEARAHHVLRAFKADSKMEPGAWLAVKTDSAVSLATEREFVARWEDNRDKAWVRFMGDDPKPIIRPEYPVALRPDDLAALIHGKFLIDSLPMP